jgi:hypothetical protein
MLAANFRMPAIGKGTYILVSIAEDNLRLEFLESVGVLISLGYQLAGTPGTADFYRKYGYEFLSLSKPPSAATVSDSGDSGKDTNSVVTFLKERKVDLVINIPEGTSRREEITSGYLMRRLAVDFGTSLLTNVKCAVLFVEALARGEELPCLSSDEFIHAPAVGFA